MSKSKPDVHPIKLINSRLKSLHSLQKEIETLHNATDDAYTAIGLPITTLPSITYATTRTRTLRGVLKSKDLWIAIFGPNNAGKSTFVNTLLGVKVAPVSAGHETARICIYQHCPSNESPTISFTTLEYLAEGIELPKAARVGEYKDIIIDMNTPLIDQLNPHLSRESATKSSGGLATWSTIIVVVKYPFPLLSSGVVLVDMPGVSKSDNDVIQQNNSKFLSKVRPTGILFTYRNPTFSTAEMAAYDFLQQYYLGGDDQNDSVFFMNTCNDIETLMEDNECSEYISAEIEEEEKQEQMEMMKGLIAEDQVERLTYLNHVPTLKSIPAIAKKDLDAAYFVAFCNCTDFTTSVNKKPFKPWNELTHQLIQSIFHTSIERLFAWMLIKSTLRYSMAIKKIADNAAYRYRCAVAFQQEDKIAQMEKNKSFKLDSENSIQLLRTCKDKVNSVIRDQCQLLFQSIGALFVSQSFKDNVRDYASTIQIDNSLAKDTVVRNMAYFREIVYYIVQKLIAAILERSRFDFSAYMKLSNTLSFPQQDKSVLDPQGFLITAIKQIMDPDDLILPPNPPAAKIEACLRRVGQLLGFQEAAARLRAYFRNSLLSACCKSPHLETANGSAWKSTLVNALFDIIAEDSRVNWSWESVLKYGITTRFDDVIESMIEDIQEKYQTLTAMRETAQRNAKKLEAPYAQILARSWALLSVINFGRGMSFNLDSNPKTIGSWCFRNDSGIVVQDTMKNLKTEQMVPILCKLGDTLSKITLELLFSYMIFQQKPHSSFLLPNLVQYHPKKAPEIVMVYPKVTSLADFITFNPDFKFTHADISHIMLHVMSAMKDFHTSMVYARHVDMDHIYLKNDDKNANEAQNKILNQQVYLGDFLTNLTSAHPSPAESSDIFSVNFRGLAAVINILLQYGDGQRRSIKDSLKWTEFWRTLSEVCLLPAKSRPSITTLIEAVENYPNSLGEMQKLLVPAPRHSSAPRESRESSSSRPPSLPLPTPPNPKSPAVASSSNTPPIEHRVTPAPRSQTDNPVSSAKSNILKFFRSKEK